MADRIQGVGEGGRSPPTELGCRNSVVVEGKCCTRRPMSLRRFRFGSRSSPFQWRMGGPAVEVVIAARHQSWGPRRQEVSLLPSQEPNPRGRVGAVVAGSPVEGVVIAARHQSWGPRRQEVSLLPSQEPNPRGRVGAVVAGSPVEGEGEGESPVVEVRLAALPPTRSLLPHQE